MPSPPRRLRAVLIRCFMVLLAAAPLLAMAQEKPLELDIVGGNAAALPIAVVPMPYQGGATAPETDVAGIVRADLDRSGQFRSLPENQLVQRSSCRASRW